MADRVTLLLQKLQVRANRLKRNKHFAFGLPFLIFVVGGSFVLKEFATVRFEFTRVNPFELPTNDERVNSQLFSTKPLDLDEEYEKIMSQINIEDWENKRIPRPWEEPSSSS